MNTFELTINRIAREMAKQMDELIAAGCFHCGCGEPAAFTQARPGTVRLEIVDEPLTVRVVYRVRAVYMEHVRTWSWSVMLPWPGDDSDER